MVIIYRLLHVSLDIRRYTESQRQVVRYTGPSAAVSSSHWTLSCHRRRCWKVHCWRRRTAAPSSLRIDRARAAASRPLHAAGLGRDGADVCPSVHRHHRRAAPPSAPPRRATPSTCPVGTYIPDLCCLCVHSWWQAGGNFKEVNLSALSCAPTGWGRISAPQRFLVDRGKTVARRAAKIGMTISLSFLHTMCKWWGGLPPWKVRSPG